MDDYDDGPPVIVVAVLFAVLIVALCIAALIVGIVLDIDRIAGAHSAPAVAARQTDVPGVMATLVPTVTPYPTMPAYPEPAEPYPAPLDTTALSLRRTGPTSAELCAPAGVVWARSGTAYIVAYFDWPGGCAEIGTHATYAGGDVYCVQVSPSPPAWVCTEPLPGWRRATWLPVVVR